MAVIVKLLSKFDDSGIKKAQSGFGGLKKTLGAIGIGYGLKQVTDTLLEAAKAASADQKSMALLNDQLKRNANATKAQITQNDKFIDTLSNQVGIVDDELRPAQARLARATGSVTKSQELLRLALDASKVSGKPLETVTTALAKAFNGNTTSLIRMFPELKKSKDLFGDLTKAVEGTAVSQADPFARFNVAMDNLKEKLGMVILPYISQFIDDMMKPGGAIDQVGKFLEDVSNPKTDAGQTFLQIKDAVAQTIGGVKDFFALFGNGDAMKGFGNIVSQLVKALPALLALKSIMVLASAGKAIGNLVTAVATITGAKGANALGGAGAILNVGTLAVSAVALSQLAALMATNAAQGTVDQPLAKKGLKVNLATGTFGAKGEVMSIPYNANAKDFKGMLFGSPTNVTINVNGGDPKATVDAVSAYIKQNGGKMPSQWGR